MKPTKRSEKPSVLSARVALLQHLLDRLLGLLPLADLLESVTRDGALQTLQLQGVAGGHEVVVVDHLDEGLDLASLFLPRLAHPSGDLFRVALDAGDKGVAVGVALVSGVNWLDDNHLYRKKLPSVSNSGGGGNN